MGHDQFSYFCRGPDDFLWGPAPVGPTLVTGPNDTMPVFTSLRQIITALWPVLILSSHGG